VGRGRAVTSKGSWSSIVVVRRGAGKQSTVATFVKADPKIVVVDRGRGAIWLRLLCLIVVVIVDFFPA
jgi:hypothetical protein